MSNERSGGASPPIYWVQRALEHVVTIPGLNPIRFFPLLFPLWQIEVTATVYESTPYQVIDEHLERGIAEGGMTSAAQLAAFFGLDTAIVDRALSFLVAVGHATRSGDSVQLTPIGYRSVHDRKLYERKESRLKLYFDGYTCAPLSREHYASSVRKLPESAAFESIQVGPARFQPLLATMPYQSEALRQLAARADRATYNVPDELEHLEALEHARAYLPCYLIEATDGRNTRYLAFSKVTGLRDEFVERICGSRLEVHATLAAENAKTEEELWTSWQQRPHLRGLSPQRLPNGVMRVTLPAQAFGEKPNLRLTRLGSYDTNGRYFLQLWCADSKLRRQAALERGLQMIRSGHIRAAVLTERLALLVEQLDIRPLSTQDLREHAQRTGRYSLARALDAISSTT